MIIFKFLKGGLPTAPLAKDRYKNGTRDSAAYLGVPWKDKTYFGESIKRVTTPNNAKILRLVLYRYYPYDNDTIYREVPEHSNRIFLPKVNIKPRLGFSYAKTPEYNILERRFNTAWNLAKHLYGGPIKEVDDPTRGAKAINEDNQRKAKGLFKGMISGQIMPTMGNIGGMIGAAWNGWIDPQSSALIGAPPILPAMPGTLMNYVTNPAELAARSDYLKTVGRGMGEVKEGLRLIAGSNKIPRGTISEDWMYPKELIAKIKGEPKKVFKTVTEEPKSTTTNKVYTNTSKKLDYYEGINSKTRSNFKNSLSMETKDNRHGYSGFTGPLRGRILIALQMIRKYPEWNRLWERQLMKIERAVDPQRKKALQKEMHALLKEFMNKMGY